MSVAGRCEAGGVAGCVLVWGRGVESSAAGRAGEIVVTVVGDVGNGVVGCRGKR